MTPPPPVHAALDELVAAARPVLAVLARVPTASRDEPRWGGTRLAALAQGTTLARLPAAGAAGV